jgi:DNA-binding PadR family transcriptional regulator
MGESKSDVLQGTLDLMVLKTLESMGPLHGYGKSAWGTSESNRRAKFYSLSPIGRRQINEETENWERVAATMSRFLAPSN